MPSASTQSIASQNAMGRWTHTFTRCPVSVAACHSEAERSPTNARCKQTHRNTNPKRAGRNLLQSHQRRSMNSYGYYFLNTACHRSSSSSSHPLPPPALPPSTYLTRPQHALTPILRAADNSYYLIPRVFEMYEASPSFESPPSRATRRNLRTNIFLST